MTIIEQDRLKKSNVLIKLCFIIILLISYKVTTNIIYNKIERDYVQNKIVRNVAPCYLNVGFRDNGVYDEKNYQMYFDALKKYNYDYDKANKEILRDLKIHLTTETKFKGVVSLLNNKAKIIYNNDQGKMYFIYESIKNKDDNNLLKFNNYITKVNNIFFICLVLLNTIGLIIIIKENNLKVFLSYLLFFGAMLMILIVEAQSRYMYAVQPLMCINSINGIKVLKKFLKKF